MSNKKEFKKYITLLLRTLETIENEKRSPFPVELDMMRDYIAYIDFYYMIANYGEECEREARINPQLYDLLKGNNKQE